jgi:hypothetical protein
VGTGHGLGGGGIAIGVERFGGEGVRHLDAVNASKIFKARGPGYLQAKRGYLGEELSKSLTDKLPEGESLVCEDL